jgi:tol-pal system protein YbgF
MKKKVFSGIILLFMIIPSLLTGQNKEKKTYELIYQDVQLLKQQIMRLDKQIESNTEDIQKIKKQLEELLSLSSLLRTMLANSSEEQKKIPAQYQIILEKIETINSQFVKLTDEILELRRTAVSTQEQTTEEGVIIPGQVPPPDESIEEAKEEAQTEKQPQSEISPNLSPREAYEMAYSDYLTGNFQLAIESFLIYKENFPDSPLADDAQYWIGECYFSLEKYENAIEQYNELILNYPGGNKVPAAYYKKGLSLIELEKKEEALSVFKILISKYPLEEETKLAQQKIKELEIRYERCKQSQ